MTEEALQLPPLIITPKVTSLEFIVNENGELVGKYKTEPWTEEEIQAYLEKHVLQLFNQLTLH